MRLITANSIFSLAFLCSFFPLDEMAGFREGLSYQRLSKKIGKMNNSSGEVQIGFQEEETKRRTTATAGKLAGPVREETEESCRYSGFKRGRGARKRISDRWALSFGLVKCKPYLDLGVEVGTFFVDILCGFCKNLLSKLRIFFSFNTATIKKVSDF